MPLILLLEVTALYSRQQRAGEVTSVERLRDHRRHDRGVISSASLVHFVMVGGCFPVCGAGRHPYVVRRVTTTPFGVNIEEAESAAGFSREGDYRLSAMLHYKAIYLVAMNIDEVAQRC